MTEPTPAAESVRVYRWQDMTSAPPGTLGSGFKLRCPDGRVRWVMSRARSGFGMSGHRGTQALWWHDLVDWRKAGLGPATWNWSHRECCPFVAPNGRRCALPVGHVSYLGLGHRLKNGRRFVSRVTGYWPTQDPKRIAA